MLGLGYLGIFVHALLVHDTQLTNIFLGVAAAGGIIVSLTAFRRFNELNTDFRFTEPVREFTVVLLTGFTLTLVYHFVVMIVIILFGAPSIGEGLMVVIPEIVFASLSLSALMIIGASTKKKSQGHEIDGNDAPEA